MANLKSAIKQMRQNPRRRMRNRAVLTRARTFIKKAELVVADGDQAKAVEAVRQAISALDRAAQKGVLKRNNASRRKSRLMHRFNAMQKQA